MVKTETLYRRYSNDKRIEFEVTAIRTRRNILASASWGHYELAHRYYDCSFPEIQDERQAHDNAVAWCMGAKEFYDSLENLDLINTDADWCFDDVPDVEKMVEQAEYYEER